MHKEVLMVTSFPPRACGIATYSEDLTTALNAQFGSGWRTRIAALNASGRSDDYDERVVYELDAYDADACVRMAHWVNRHPRIGLVHVQFEFGLFGGTYGSHLLAFLLPLKKPFVITYHTVLPAPDADRRALVTRIAALAAMNLVMTHDSQRIMRQDYGVDEARLAVVAHGTHGTVWRDKDELSRRYDTVGRKVLSTFGLLSSNKSIETGIAAMAQVVERHPDALYLVLGRTHPGVVQHEGERYRRQLEEQVATLGLEQHVRFVNKYLELDELLEYLQLTDLYLFTSRDPHQAVSGTFSYAMSCGCPIIATPIPHAHELLNESTGVLLENFCDPAALATAAVALLDDPARRHWMGSNAYHQMCASTWNNVAISHAQMYARQADLPLSYDPPTLALDHLRRLTNATGLLQFANFNVPDPTHGCTLDDNARALVVSCQYQQVTGRIDARDLQSRYLHFLLACQQPDGLFLNYTDADGKFTDQNQEVNLEDANMRALWALGCYLHHATRCAVPEVDHQRAQAAWVAALPHARRVRSPRAVSFAMKGLWQQQQICRTVEGVALADALAGRLLELYHDHAEPGWQWFEPYLTYANSILPEALLYAYRLTGRRECREIAYVSLRFLTGHLFVSRQQLRVISNQGWWCKGQPRGSFGEQSIDAAYTLHTLLEFAAEEGGEAYAELARVAFGWYLGNNRLGLSVYNPTTGGCFDGLEAYGVNLNQGAESTVCYLMARLLVEKAAQAGRRSLSRRAEQRLLIPIPNHQRIRGEMRA